MPPISCDIFCAVIDNLGDAGVCWRLSRQLAIEHGWRVRLWIDDPAPLARLAPAQDIVEVCHWTGDFSGVEPAQLVIEAFACPLPAAYVAAMAAQPQAPVWINLEYLSAENWVVGCHGLPSPQADLQKHFFFPGFVPGTGGLLREKDYAIPPVPQKGFPSVTPTFEGPLEVSLFCYNNPQLPALLEQWRDGDQPITCHVADGLPRRQVERWLGASLPARMGNLRLEALPFLPQIEYDTLLQRCHLNFVRGEDSFVRAQWAERPFVWQIYPQADDAHQAKLEAFLSRYTDDAAVRNFFRAWNGNGPLDWPAFAARLPALAARAPDWAKRIAAHGDLAGNLVNFCASRL
jgi:uncharacterized repeat protein (TIGR03837 family)